MFHKRRTALEFEDLFWVICIYIYNLKEYLDKMYQAGRVGRVQTKRLSLVIKLNIVIH